MRYTARHGPFNGPASALRRDDLAVDDAVAEVRARRYFIFAGGPAGPPEADVPQRRDLVGLHELDEEQAHAAPRNSKWDVKGGGLLTFVDELFDLWYIAPPSRG